MHRKPAIAFVWSTFGPYHRDRAEAVAQALADTHRVVGIEIAVANADYPFWDRCGSDNFEQITLLADRAYHETGTWTRTWALLRACLSVGARDVFFCHYETADVLLAASCLRLLGRRVYMMFESKFDDKPRALRRELLKPLFCLPYNAAIVGGPRTEDYLRFLGFRRRPMFRGYDTVSMDRVRAMAGAPPAPGGLAFAARHFTIVARLVAKKNIAMALAAYASYRDLAGAGARDLVICGSGELGPALQRDVETRRLPGVRFLGAVQAPEVARTLASSLSLVLPSKEEQWGLVVNEAVFMGLPVLCSDNVGARDLLVRNAVNGYTFEPNNPEGLARLMLRLATDEAEWRRLCEGSLRLAPLGDTRNFADGVMATLASFAAGRAVQRLGSTPTTPSS